MLALQFLFLGRVADVQQVGELGRREDKGIQDQRRFVPLGLRCQRRFQSLHFLVQTQLGVREIEIAQPLRIDKGQPLLASGIVYLSLFARIEHDLVRRAQAVLARPEHERESAWGDEVAAPLRTLTRVLGRTAGSMSEAEAVFKLGELLQLRRELAHLAPSLPTPDIFALWNTVPVHPSLTGR